MIDAIICGKNMVLPPVLDIGGIFLKEAIGNAWALHGHWLIPFYELCS